MPLLKELREFWEAAFAINIAPNGASRVNDCVARSIEIILVARS